MGNSKRMKYKILILFILLCVSVGYAYLTSSLSINGSTLIKNPVWDIHFENIQVVDGSVTGEQVIGEPEIDNDRTTVSFHIRLKEPGEFYEFTVDAVNAGTIDAMINTISSFNLTATQRAYISATVTYEDGEEIQSKQQLLAGDTAVYKINILYRTDLDPADLPSTAAQLDLDFSVEYVQKDETSIMRNAEKTLYNVLKSEATSEGLALKYNGAHQDSMNASLSTKNIYYWYADNDTDGTAVTNKYNVLFANHCWQMIRTTDTGGVKMIYNGEPENGKCLDTRGSHVGYASKSLDTLSSSYYYGTGYNYDSTSGMFSLSGTITSGEIKVGQYTCKSTFSSGTCTTLYYVFKLDLDSEIKYYLLLLNSNSVYSQFGTLPYNHDNSTPAYVGYMYNTLYKYKVSPMGREQTVEHSSVINTNYWFADSVTWDSPVSNQYSLVNPYQVSSTSDYPNLVGKYTFKKSDQSYTSYTLCYIVAVDGSTMYYVELLGGNNAAYYNDTYTFGSSYTDNGNGTYTINNPTTINRFDWYAQYQNIGANKYICHKATNNTCSDLWYTKSTSATIMKYIRVSLLYKYSNGFTWDGSKYILDNSASESFWNVSDSSNLEKIINAHYTCFNASGQCTKLAYIIEYKETNSAPMGIPPYLTFIELENGKNIKNAIDEMLYNDDVNENDSFIKTGIDEWYKNNMIEYSDYLEDIIFCNDRSMSNYDSNGWNPNSGYNGSRIYFYGSTDLNCPNVIDRFSVSNSKAHLTYKVGLMSFRELELLNSSVIRRTGGDYWLGSPYQFKAGYAYEDAYSRIMRTNGSFTSFELDASAGVRPAISLRPGIMYTSGDGSKDNPYVVDTN